MNNLLDRGLGMQQRTGTLSAAIAPSRNRRLLLVINEKYLNFRSGRNEPT